MKLTLTRGFKTEVRAPNFRSAVKNACDLKFESNEPVAGTPCWNALLGHARQG